MNRIISLALVVTLAACPPPTPTPDGGALIPIATSVSPDRGPIEGGTSVTINGTNFVSGATVTFGALRAATTTFESDRRLIAVTPPSSAGAVSVTVTNPGGRLTTLPGAFTFTAPTNPATITESILQNPANTTLPTGIGMSTVLVQVIAHVQVPTITPGTGPGAGVRGQVGFASTVSAAPTSADFTWTDANYLGDVDGPAGGDGARDAYSGTLPLPGLAAGSPASVFYLAARFSVDDGQSWTIADRDGSANGVATAQLSRVTVTPPASVDWCKLGGEAIAAPPTFALRGSAMGPIIYGQVFKAGVTSMSGAGTGIKGALGYGQAGADPATWTWTDATFNIDSGGGQNDEFQAQLPNPGDGTYKFAFRFSHDNGPWSYCDADGLGTDGFTEAQAGTLTVTPLGIDSCILQFPHSLTTSEGTQSDQIYGRVFVQGLTEALGPALGIEGQVGYGAPSTPPSDPSWTWSPNASFNVDDSGGGDEYSARITGPAPGTFGYAYRFRLGGGAWTYCDKTGSADGLQQTELGALTALPFGAAIQSCRLSTVTPAALPSGSPLTITARTLIPGVSGNVGASPNLRMQVGLGPRFGNASTSGLFGWKDATFSADVSGNDEFTATVYPAYTGWRAVSARSSLDGVTWTYCDLNGSDVNGYEVSQQYDVDVSNHAEFTFCNLQFPATADGGSTIYGQIYRSDLTPDAGTPFIVQLGTGPEPQDPGLAWSWQPANFLGFGGLGNNNNEYRSVLAASATPCHRYAFRYSLDAGVWCYGDLDGSGNGFTGGGNLGLIE